MDYDNTKIPQNYDLARSYDNDALEMWLDQICKHIPSEGISKVLDLGCGTGRYSRALSEKLNAHVTGLDPSKKMLDQALKKVELKNLKFKRGSAEALPFEDSSMDMIFMSNVFHHLNDPGAVVIEARRVLNAQGYFVLRNSTADQADSFPYVGLFPGIKNIIQNHQPHAQAVIGLFCDAGFRVITHNVISHQMAPDWKSFAKKVKHRADSLLARMPEKDFQAGLSALDQYVKELSLDSPVTVNIDLFVFKVGGDARYKS